MDETHHHHHHHHHHFFHTNTTPEKRHSDVKSEQHFAIDDLLNFPTDDTITPHPPVDDDEDNVYIMANAGGSSTVITTTVLDDTCNSPPRRSLTDTPFSHHDLCVPYDDMAELEWLSNFVEDSFSTEDMEKLQLISGFKPCRPGDAYDTHKLEDDIDKRANNNPIFGADMTVQGKARTKRSRAAPNNWTSRLAALPQPSFGPNNIIAATISSESESDIASSTSIGKKAPPTKKKEREIYNDNDQSHNGDGSRKCLHCATDKTPQWRTGPLGPKTLCNACGVRYKSGRLVPEYRPAASPTFVLAKHSNSHRKVLELRRQKEMQSAHPQPFYHHQNMMFADHVPKGDDYLIHQHIGPDYRQLI